MNKESYLLDCCFREKFIFDEKEFFNEKELLFLQGVLNSIEENPKKNALRLVQTTIDRVELRKLQKKISEIKEFLKGG